MLDGNGGKIPRQEVPSLPGMNDIRGPWKLHLYDIQVASCEFSRWLRDSGSANRLTPEMRAKLARTADVPRRAQE